jgi:hypothetical protein
MAGIPKNYAPALVELGPGDAYIFTELPATGARPIITAAADGSLTPDGTASAGAIHMGYTGEGCKVLYKPSIVEFTPDESTVPAIVAIQGEPSSIQGNWWQTLDMVTMSKMMAGGSYSTGSGFSQVTWGGKQTVPTFACMVIAPVYADPTKVMVIMLYKAYNATGFEMEIGRKKVASSPFEFKAQEIGFRPVGDRIGIIYKTQ